MQGTDVRPFNSFVTFCSTPDLAASAHFYEEVIRDPTGCVVEIQRFDDPAWAG
jgi:hypothetical protein